MYSKRHRELQAGQREDSHVTRKYTPSYKYIQGNSVGPLVLLRIMVCSSEQCGHYKSIRVTGPHHATQTLFTFPNGCDAKHYQNFLSIE